MGFSKKLFFGNTTTIETPQPTPTENVLYKSGKIKVNDFFKIEGRGFVLTGDIVEGGLVVGFTELSGVVIQGIEAFNKTLKTAIQGQQVGILTNIKDKDAVKSFLEKYPDKIVEFFAPEQK